MSTSVVYKPALAIAAALGLLSMGACETGKGLSLSAADLAAAGTANRNTQSGSGGMAWDLSTGDQPAATPTSQAAPAASTGTPTTAAASAKSARTLAAMTDATASKTNMASGLPAADAMQMTGNTVLASADDTAAIADLTPAAGVAQIVDNIADSVGQGLDTGAATAQTQGTLAVVTPATAPMSGAADVAAAGQPVVGSPDAPTAPVGIAILSAAPAAGSLASVGVLNSGTPLDATVVGTSLVSTSTGNAANASNAATSLVGVTAASTTQTTGTLASVGLANGGQLASLAFGSTPVVSVPSSAVVPATTPDASGAPYTAASAAALVGAPAGTVIAGSNSRLLGSAPSTGNSSSFQLAKYVVVKKLGQ